MSIEHVSNRVFSLKVDHQELVGFIQNIMKLYRIYDTCSKELNVMSAISNSAAREESSSTQEGNLVFGQALSTCHMDCNYFGNAIKENLGDSNAVIGPDYSGNYQPVVDLFSLIATLTESQRRATIHAAAATNTFFILRKSLLDLGILYEKALARIHPPRWHSRPSVHKAFQASMHHIHIFLTEADTFSRTFSMVRPWIDRTKAFLELGINECQDVKMDLMIRVSEIGAGTKCTSTWLGNAGETRYRGEKVARELKRRSIQDAEAKMYEDCILILEYFQRSCDEKVARDTLNAWIAKEMAYWECAAEKEAIKKRIMYAELEATDLEKAIWVGNAGETAFLEANGLEPKEEVDVAQLLEGIQQYASYTSIFFSRACGRNAVAVDSPIADKQNRARPTSLNRLIVGLDDKKSARTTTKISKFNVQALLHSEVCGQTNNSPRRGPSLLSKLRRLEHRDQERASRQSDAICLAEMAAVIAIYDWNAGEAAFMEALADKTDQVNSSWKRRTEYRAKRSALRTGQGVRIVEIEDAASIIALYSGSIAQTAFFEYQAPQTPTFVWSKWLLSKLLSFSTGVINVFTSLSALCVSLVSSCCISVAENLDGNGE
ncbi:hypothetical protein HDU67_006524 [Dinochytrium kinnereticum]|nr:hypothetical protein HDU67_006524 [Dinochytrium kinnereticum]